MNLTLCFICSYSRARGQDADHELISLDSSRHKHDTCEGIEFAGRRACQSSWDVIKPESRAALSQRALNQNHIKLVFASTCSNRTTALLVKLIKYTFNSDSWNDFFIT